MLLNTALAADMRIVVVSHGQAHSPFWKVVKNGVDQAGKDMKVDVAYRAPETYDMVAMAKLIDAAGLGAGALMKALGGENALCVKHEVGNVALDLRCEGFARGFGGSSKVLATGKDPQTLISMVKAALSADESIDTVMTLGASSAAEPALEALEQIGMLGEVKLGTFDLSANILKAIDKKQVAFIIDQQQYMQGYLPVVILALYNRYGLMPGGNIPTGPGFVTRANVAKVIDLSAKGIR